MVLTTLYCKQQTAKNLFRVKENCSPNERARRQIITYPVPAETNTPIIVELPFAIENLEKGQIDIYNSVGILVKRYTNLSNIMQIQPIAQKGVYILKLTTSDGKAHTTKFMVK